MYHLLKKAALLCAIFAASLPAIAQTAVAGNKVLDNTGALLASGQWCFGTSCFTVTNGAFSGSVTAGTATVTVTNGGSTTYLTVPNVTIAGSYFSWDTFVVPSNGNISGIGAPLIACTPGALYSQTDGAQNKWQCQSINGAGTWNGLPAPGSPNSFSFGTVTTLAPGAPATAVNVGSSGAPIVNLGIPQGYPGCVVGSTCTSVLPLTGGTLTGPLTWSTPAAASTTLNNLGGLPISGGELTGAIGAPNMPVSATGPTYSAVGDNSTDDTAQFEAMESSATNEFYLPPGYYKTTLASLSKRYWGPGEILLGQNPSMNGTPSSVEGNYDNNLSGPNSLISSGNSVTTVWIGDSITFGYDPTLSSPVAQSYPYLVQSWLNQKEGGIGQGLYTIGGNFDPTRIATTGTVTNGTAGPLHNDLILSSGATVAVNSTNTNYFAFWYQQQSGGGTVTVTNGTGTYGTQSTSGTAQNDVLSTTMMAPAGTPSAQTITLSCSGGPCEITGIFASSAISAAQNPWVFEMQAFSGYATSDFTSAAVLASIAAQVIYHGQGPFWNAVIALGTNDIYSSTKAVTAATFKANLITIVTGLEALSGRPILTVPLQPIESTYHPVYEPFADYRNAVYQVAREYSLPVVDLSELNLAAIGAYQTDGLHPNQYGYQVMADFWYRKLHLASLAVQTRPAPTPGISFASVASGLTTPTCISNSCNSQAGEVSTSASTFTTGAMFKIVFSGPMASAPVSCFVVPQFGSAASGFSAQAGTVAAGGFTIYSEDTLTSVGNIYLAYHCDY
jgi:GDSL-like Lipase/Acylhydrolase family